MHSTGLLWAVGQAGSFRRRRSKHGLWQVDSRHRGCAANSCSCGTNGACDALSRAEPEARRPAIVPQYPHQLVSSLSCSWFIPQFHMGCDCGTDPPPNAWRHGVVDGSRAPPPAFVRCLWTVCEACAIRTFGRCRVCAMPLCGMPGAGS